MNRKMYMAFLALIVVFGTPLFAQTAAQLDSVMAADAVTCEQAAYFVLDGTSNAFQQAAENGWLKAASPDDPITIGQLSFLMMKAFDIKGGLMYRIAPSSRYAYRSMVNRRYIQGAADPAMTLSGARFLLILMNVLENEGDAQ